MDKTQLERKAYSPKEVMELLGISQTTIYRWLESGQLRPSRSASCGGSLWTPWRSC